MKIFDLRQNFIIRGTICRSLEILIERIAIWKSHVMMYRAIIMRILKYFSKGPSRMNKDLQRPYQCFNLIKPPPSKTWPHQA